MKMVTDYKKGKNEENMIFIRVITPNMMFP